MPSSADVDHAVVIARLCEARGAGTLRVDRPCGGGAVDWQVGGRVVPR